MYLYLSGDSDVWMLSVFSDAMVTNTNPLFYPMFLDTQLSMHIDLPHTFLYIHTHIGTTYMMELPQKMTHFLILLTADCTDAMGPSINYVRIFPRFLDPPTPPVAHSTHLNDPPPPLAYVQSIILDPPPLFFPVFFFATYYIPNECLRLDYGGLGPFCSTHANHVSDLLFRP